MLPTSDKMRWTHARGELLATASRSPAACACWSQPSNPGTQAEAGKQAITVGHPPGVAYVPVIRRAHRLGEPASWVTSPP